jgi:hypothetical protein
MRILPAPTPNVAAAPVGTLAAARGTAGWRRRGEAPLYQVLEKKQNREIDKVDPS